jgi:hypothetical protein
VHAVAIDRRQIERAHAFDGHFAPLALDAGHADERGVDGERAAAVRALEAHG